MDGKWKLVYVGAKKLIQFKDYVCSIKNKQLIHFEIHLIAVFKTYLKKYLVRRLW